MIQALVRMRNHGHGNGRLALTTMVGGNVQIPSETEKIMASVSIGQWPVAAQPIAHSNGSLATAANMAAILLVREQVDHTWVSVISRLDVAVGGLVLTWMAFIICRWVTEWINLRSTFDQLT